MSVTATATTTTTLTDYLATDDICPPRRGCDNQNTLRHFCLFDAGVMVEPWEATHIAESSSA